MAKYEASGQNGSVPFYEFIPRTATHIFLLRDVFTDDGEIESISGFNKSGRSSMVPYTPPSSTPSSTSSSSSKKRHEVVVMMGEPDQKKLKSNVEEANELLAMLPNLSSGDGDEEEEKLKEDARKVLLAKVLGKLST